jgi:hypothetical protein
MYLSNLLKQMGFAQQEPTQVYEGSTVCIEQGNNVIDGRENAKNTDIMEHFTHEVIQNGQMKLVCFSTTSQLADILTKQIHF